MVNVAASHSASGVTNALLTLSYTHLLSKIQHRHRKCFTPVFLWGRSITLVKLSVAFLFWYRLKHISPSAHKLMPDVICRLGFGLAYATVPFEQGNFSKHQRMLFTDQNTVPCKTYCSSKSYVITIWRVCAPNYSKFRLRRKQFER